MLDGLELEARLRVHFPDLQKLEALRTEVSARRYYRLHLSSGATTIAAAYPQSLTADHDFLLVQQDWLAQGIRLPGLQGSDLEHGILFLEDVGDEDLNVRLQSVGPAEQTLWLQRAMDTLIQIQQLQPSPPVSSRSFDRAKLWSEMEHTFAGIGLGLKEPASKPLEFAVRTILEEVCRYLEHRATVVTHRDFHSRNIMVHSGELYCIDFQDARMGSVYYDLASLLMDPYLDWNPEREEACLQYFIAHRLLPAGIKHSQHHFYSQALQRLFKAFGTYCHQVFAAHDDRFLPSLHMALRRLEWLVQRAAFPDALYLYLQHLQRHFSLL